MGIFRYHIINGEIHDGNQPTISIHDVGLLRGYGIFDFFPIQGGQAVFESDYFDRFYRSATRIGIEVPCPREALTDQIKQLCEHNGQDHGYVKLVLTGGNSTNGYTPAKSNLVIIQHDEVSYDDQVYKDGIHLLLQRFVRSSALVKSLNYANAIRYRDLMEKEVATDLLYHDGTYIAETSRANFFIVDKKGVLHTSDTDILEGITRKQVLAIAKSIMQVNLAPLPLTQVARAHEAFITSTTKYVLPVTKLNNHPVGDGKVGPVSRQLCRLLKEHMEKYKDMAVGIK